MVQDQSIAGDIETSRTELVLGMVFLGLGLIGTVSLLIWGAGL